MKNRFNIVVYDGSQTIPSKEVNLPSWISAMFGDAPITSLTSWWKLGGVFQAAKGYADCIIEAKSWNEVFAKLIAQIKADREKNGVRPVSVQIWQHGSKGKAYINGEALSVKNLSSNGKHKKKLDELAELLCEESSFWFRGCSCFSGKEGKIFAVAYRDFFGCALVGHTFDISVIQGGTYILDPNENPGWPDNEGNEMSSIYSPHKIFCTTSYPPPFF